MITTLAKACMRCHIRPPWSSKLCWECHRAYAASTRQAVSVDANLWRGVAIGLCLVAGAVGVGAPLFVAIAVVPIAIVFGSFSSTRHRRAWIERANVLPIARALPGTPRATEPDSDTHR